VLHGLIDAHRIPPFPIFVDSPLAVNVTEVFRKHPELFDKEAGVFLDQFFSKGSLDGKKLSFTTKPIHGTWYEFAGVIGRGQGKTPDQEGYWSIRGTLKQFDLDDAKNVSSKSRELTLNSFPQDLEDTESPK